MTLGVTDAALAGYHTGNDQATDPASQYQYASSVADYVIPADDILNIKISQRANERVDTANTNLKNDRGKWSGEVRPGDRLTLWLATTISGDYKTDNATYRPQSTADRRQEYGEARYGEYGEDLHGSDLIRRWTGQVTNGSISARGGPRADLQIKGGDYVFKRLADRRWVRTMEGRPISGTEDAILNTALRERLPEIDRSQMESLGVTTDYKSNFRNILDVLKEALRRGGGAAAARHMSLIVRPLDEITPKFTITHDSDDWYGNWESSWDDQDLMNNLRVVGATQSSIDDSQEVVDTYQQVSAGDRVQIPITTRKSNLARASVWTDPGTDNRGDVAGDDLRIRVQVDDGGQPVAPNDSSSDIVAATINSEDMALDGWSSVGASDESIPGRDSWLMIEPTGDEGQRLGGTTNSNGEFQPAFRTYYPYSIRTTRPNYESIEKYRVRDKLLTDENIETIQALTDTIDGQHEKFGEPHWTISCTAWSERLHSLRPAESVTVEAPRTGIDGEEMICTERTTNIQQSELSTDLTLAARSTL